MARIPRGIANNNPGNIRKTDINWQGEVVGTDSAFETFATPEYGIRAMMKCLQNYERKYGPQTIETLIDRWAPPVENDTGSYVRHVAQQCGVSKDAIFSTKNKAEMIQLTKAITLHENGQNPYADSVFAQAWEMLGG